MHAILKHYATPHTPGPWTLGGATDNNPHGDFDVFGAEFGHYCTGRVAVVERRAGGAYLAESCSPQAQRLTAEANARLIAAAPELLSALRGLLQHFHGPQCLAADYPGSFYMAEVEAAQDAIKAATGGRDQ